MKTMHSFLAIFSLLISVNRAIGHDGYQHVGLASAGQVAFEYVGVVRQNGAEFETFGYFTYIRDMPDELLFFDDEKRDESNARFTLHSRSKMTNRSIVPKMFSVNVTGEMVVYVRPRRIADASFNRGDIFTIGDRIATFDMRGQSIVAVTAPNVGVNSATLEMQQTQADWKGFSDGQKEYAFGRPGSLLRFSHIGFGERSQKEPPIATISVAGNAVSVADGVER